MLKNPRHESFKSFFGSYVDNEKDEQLRETKTEIDNKVERISKLLEEEDNKEKKSILKLIEDFHKQYQSLYKSYDHLTKGLRKKAHGMRMARAVLLPAQVPHIRMILSRKRKNRTVK